MTVLCKFIFQEYCETSDPSACSEFIKDRVSRYMTIFRDSANPKSEYSPKVSYELAGLVNQLESSMAPSIHQTTKDIFKTFYNRPFLLVQLPIDLLPRIVYNFRDALVKDIKDLNVDEKSPVGMRLNLINKGLLTFETIVHHVRQAERSKVPPNEMLILEKLLNMKKKTNNAANKEAIKRTSSLNPPVKVAVEKKPRSRKRTTVNPKVDRKIQDVVLIDAPDFHDKQVIGNYDSILSDIDQILDLPSSNLPPSLDHLKRKEQATVFIQDMNKYFELL